MKVKFVKDCKYSNGYKIFQAVKGEVVEMNDGIALLYGEEGKVVTPGGEAIRTWGSKFGSKLREIENARSNGVHTN